VPARDDKLGAAKELALALAYVALSANDAVRLHSSPAGAAHLSGAPAAGERRRVRQLLADAGARGLLALGETLESYARRHPTPGLAIVVSDLMMDPAEVERGLHAFRMRRYQVLLLHVVGPGELEPGGSSHAGCSRTWSRARRVRSC